MCESTEDCIDRDDRKSSKNLSAETDTEKTGIGIIFGRHLAGPKAALPYFISTVLIDGTAHKSGLIKAGDFLHEINGVEVSDMAVEQITSLIMGQPSSAITITISTPDKQNELPRLGYVKRTVLLNRKSSSILDLPGALDSSNSHVASTSHDVGKIKKDLAKSISSPAEGARTTEFKGKDSNSQSTEEEKLGISVEVEVQAWEDELTCSICLEFLWEPVKLDCGHHFCRCCLWRTQQLSPDGQRCPNCRADIVIDARTANTDQALQARVDATVPADERLLRKAECVANVKQMDQLAVLKMHGWPIFFTSARARQGITVKLNLGEPRYLEMAKRIMGPDGKKMFILADSLTERRNKGMLVSVQSATTQIEGDVCLVGRVMYSIPLNHVVVDYQAHGLHYALPSPETFNFPS
jgi:hypothetical protein